jgi:hypothetical protein
MSSQVIPAEAVEAAVWVALVIAGYVALCNLIPEGQDRAWAVAAFTTLVLASGTWLVAELRKAR